MGYLFVKASTSPSSRGAGGTGFGGATLPTPCFWDIFRVLAIFPQTKQMPRSQLSVFPSAAQAGLQPSHISLATCREDSSRAAVAFCTICRFFGANMKLFRPKWHGVGVAQQRGCPGHPGGGRHPNPTSSPRTPSPLPDAGLVLAFICIFSSNSGTLLLLHTVASPSRASAQACPVCCEPRGCRPLGPPRFWATPHHHTAPMWLGARFLRSHSNFSLGTAVSALPQESPADGRKQARLLIIYQLLSLAIVAAESFLSPEVGQIHSILGHGGDPFPRAAGPALLCPRGEPSPRPVLEHGGFWGGSQCRPACTKGLGPLSSCHAGDASPWSAGGRGLSPSCGQEPLEGTALGLGAFAEPLPR